MPTTLSQSLSSRAGQQSRGRRVAYRGTRLSCSSSVNGPISENSPNVLAPPGPPECHVSTHRRREGGGNALSTRSSRTKQRSVPMLDPTIPCSQIRSGAFASPFCAGKYLAKALMGEKYFDRQGKAIRRDSEQATRIQIRARTRQIGCCSCSGSR
jgi:hypothetical protein